MSDKIEKSKILPRDAFIDEIFLAAKKNPNIYFITIDLGAKALDRFRVELPNQLIHAGISEQNAMDVAAGLAQNGKIVYVYAMAPFVTLRCYEQIKVAIASMFLPVTIIGNGVGYSYNDAGPTHYATEDLSCMRALGGIEILTASDTETVLQTARLTYTKPAFRYVRLDRAFLPDIYPSGDKRILQDGIVEIEPGEKACIIAS
ncbi:MAG TPA: 1-deoxy-D-xylulose-5-phosphate synthase, partial [Verrucomicrobiae bacterium]|nr:1-deoxy-D-xylulose-5-phosphate synthase [Verrucomicrobiae bacterium]